LIAKVFAASCGKANRGRDLGLPADGENPHTADTNAKSLHNKRIKCLEIGDGGWAAGGSGRPRPTLITRLVP